MFRQNLICAAAAPEAFHYIWQPLLMMVLLVGSAFFSGAETAFFNLSHRQIRLFHQSTHRLQKLAAHLLSRPSQLLGSLLLGNMIVNILFYATAGVLAVKTKQHVGVTAAVATAFFSFFALVLFGEILPKSVAYANSKSFGIFAALPAMLCLKILAPVLFVLRLLTVEPFLRLLLGRQRRPEPITTVEFKLLVDQARRRGLISADENKLLAEVVELGFLKVRHVMHPRVDMTACAVADPPQRARELMQRDHLTKIPVYTGAIDNIVGLVYLRDLLLRPGVPLDKLVQPVHYVPEQKTVESLLEFFRRAHADMAVVVDEYGGIAGSVRLEDIAEELFGPIEMTDEMEPVSQTGPFEYRLAGNLAIHDWAEVFGIDIEQMRLATIGGLVTALLGKIPKAGDVAHLGNLRFTVENVRRHRIITVIMTLESLKADAR